MKIKLYIVTYKNPEHLHENLSTLLSNDYTIDGFEGIKITVINNHSEFAMHEEYAKYVNVMHNMTRPDFSVGHLSRDWNAALVNGFVNLKNPDCDLVILSQDDTIWQPDAIKKIVEQSKRYSAIFLGNGDCVCAFTAEAIRKIGLWDERFSCNGFHEMDMFLRSVIYNGDNTSINDVWHQLLPNIRNQFALNPYLHNPLPYGPKDVIYRPDSNPDRVNDKNLYSQYHATSRELFKYKWGEYPELLPIQQQAEKHKDGPVTPQFIFYPYFEKDVYDLKKKNYLHVDHYNWI